MEKLCKNCQKEIIGKNQKAEFCSIKCKSKFNSDLNTARNKNNPDFKKYHRKKSKEWYANNHERQNKNMLEQYQKHKRKWNLRKTASLNKKNILEMKGYKCEVCGSRKNIELHHKEYISIPSRLKSRWHKKERIEFYCSIIDVLCRKCHKKVVRTF